MTQIPVRIKVTCSSCRTGFRLNQEQYRELIKRSRVALKCPHCANDFAYSPVARERAANPEPPPKPRREEASTRAEPIPARGTSELPPVAGPSSAAEFPPPPFAPLNGGTPAPAKAVSPPFAPFTPLAAASSPQSAAAPAGEEAKKLTLNDRWKQLPPWVQWTVIGVLIVILAIIIFAMPTGGGNAPPQTEPRPSREPSPPRTEEERPHPDTKTSGEKKPEPGKGRAADDKKKPAKAAREERDSEERQP